MDNLTYEETFYNHLHDEQFWACKSCGHFVNPMEDRACDECGERIGG